MGYRSSVLHLGVLALNIFQAQASGACKGIPVFPGSGSLVEIDRSDIALMGDAYYENKDEEFILARGDNQQGALKFGSILKKLGIERFDWGMEMSFRARSDEKRYGYGFILTYGGSEQCVRKKVEEGNENLFFEAKGKQTFCKGVTLAAWADKDFTGFFVLVNGELQEHIRDEKADIFDKEHCLVMHINQPTSKDKGSVAFVLDGKEIGATVKFDDKDLEGDGEDIFAFAATSKAGDGLVQVSEVEVKSRRDIREASLFNDADKVVQSGIQSLVWSLAVLAMMGVVAKVAFNYGKNMNYR
mmetsp:Transcript_22928/g.33248  ORF Transcript_22928/g.33248 Transcript_22928/m.33248 type:complete len:300 (-) Transcript_22928:288-1187(-)